jgi:hypothetical protein
VQCFLAERYMAHVSSQALLSAVEGDRFAAEASSMRHVQTIYVPDDETCFTLFAAQSAQAIDESSRHFELGYRRIMLALVPGEDEPTAHRSPFDRRR